MYIIKIEAVQNGRRITLKLLSYRRDTLFLSQAERSYGTQTGHQIVPAHDQSQA